jgi:hypothetical protein
LIKYNNEIMGHAFRHAKLYSFSLNGSINVVTSENNVNVFSSKNKRKRIDSVSSKVCHHCLCHILSRGRTLS